MFTLQKPTEEEINDFIEAQNRLSLSYSEIGETKNFAAPFGYPINHLRRELGKGEKIYKKAVAALFSWQMYATDWTEVHPLGVPVREGEAFVTLVNHLGFWSLNPCRIIYTLNEETRHYSQNSFAIGTLPAHSEKGEERFTVEWNKETDVVKYELYAFARAQHWLAKIGFPFVPLFQKRFARDSYEVMLDAVNS
ncbi:MAG TPA: DUF1990 domain-containing protein [Pyrinomonadaceae bacterium]|jgi:uncharacterized protein (UPF0548 family)